MKLQKMVRMFNLQNKRVIHNGEMCVLRKSFSNILQMAHDSKLIECFEFGKTMSMWSSIHWRYKSRDVMEYMDGCIMCHKFKDSNQRS